MTGKVFISCGQRSSNEIAAVEEIGQLLRDEFHLNPYIAIRVQSLGDIMAITNELRSSDYYLFIDFMRQQKKPEDLSYSLFTHQELALAHHLGFSDQVIILCQKGLPHEGFLKYMQSNPESFNTPDQLKERLRILVREKGWRSDYSRNLIVTSLKNSDLLSYADHTGSSLQMVWLAKIENRRPDVAAVGTVCILDSIRDSTGNNLSCEDRAYLKWAGQAGYERTLLPQDFGLVDIFAVRPDTPGLFLHSLRDTPREPIIVNNGDYEMTFKVFAREFPLLEFTVSVHLHWQPMPLSIWINQSMATIKTP